MLIKHLTEEEVQQYALTKQHGEKQVAEHIHLCKECRMKVEVYQLLITGIKQQQQPVFDFDLSQMVLQQLPSPKTKVSPDKWLVWLLASIGIGFIGGVFYFFPGYFDFFEGVRAILIYLIIITAITVLAYLLNDMYKKYKHGMKTLDLY